MSSFVVSYATIAETVKFLVQHSTCSQTLHEYDPLRHDYAAEPEKLTADIYQMNLDAVAHRYGAASAEPCSDNLSGRGICRITPVQAVKSLACILYQCDEGDVSLRPLYTLLETMRNQVALGIVTNSNEYDAADWG